MLQKCNEYSKDDPDIQDELRVTSRTDLEEIYVCLKKMEITEQFINVCQPTLLKRGETLLSPLLAREALLNACETYVYDNWVT